MHYSVRRVSIDLGLISAVHMLSSETLKILSPSLNLHMSTCLSWKINLSSTTLLASQTHSLSQQSEVGLEPLFFNSSQSCLFFKLSVQREFILCMLLLPLTYNCLFSYIQRFILYQFVTLKGTPTWIKRVQTNSLYGNEKESGWLATGCTDVPILFQTSCISRPWSSELT